VTDKPAEWFSDDCTEHAKYVPELDAVRYTQAQNYEDGRPGFVIVFLSEAVTRDILDLFPEKEPA
jgi:hypothetical protein